MREDLEALLQTANYRMGGVCVISFIVSTYRAADFARLEANLAATVDASYEVIPVENPGRYSLTEAYNIGARKSRGAFLCFVHEDVMFCDSKWDISVLERFSTRPELGLIGVAGAVVRPDLSTGFFTGDSSMIRANFRHFGEDNTMSEFRCTHPVEECEVRVLDGIFLLARREAWERFPFDEDVRGFHFYDVDFSFRIAQHYRVEVAPDLMIEHCSTELKLTPRWHRKNFDKSWVKAALAYQPKREGLKFDELDPETILEIKRYWLFYICAPNCPLILRWKYWRYLGLTWSQAYGGMPVFFPRLFKIIRLWRYKRWRKKQGLAPIGD